MKDAKGYAYAIDKWYESAGPVFLEVVSQQASWGDIDGARKALDAHKGEIKTNTERDKDLYGIASIFAQVGEIPDAMHYADLAKAKRDPQAFASAWTGDVGNFAAALFRAGADKEAETILSEIDDQQLLQVIRMICVQTHLAHGDIDGAVAFTQLHNLHRGAGFGDSADSLIAAAYADRGDIEQVDKLIGTPRQLSQYQLIGRALAFAGNPAKLDKRFQGLSNNHEAQAWFCLGVLNAATFQKPLPPALQPIPDISSAELGLE